MVFESAISFLKTNPSYEDFERELQFHLNFTRTIQSYRNTRFPGLRISKLPCDVLSLIFEHLALSCDRDPDTDLTSQPYSAWLAVTQVCREWRDVALQTPRMWSCIYDNTEPEIMALFLQRSGSSPLRLRSHPAFPTKTSNNMAKFLLHANRLHEVDVQCAESTSRCFDPPFQFSNLRVLKLRGCWWKPTLPVSNVLLALETMGHLQTLALDDVLRASESGTISDGIMVVLPRLMALRITTMHIECLVILAHISCPNVESIHALCDGRVKPHALAPVAKAFYALIPTDPSTWQTILVSTPSHSRCRASMNIRPGLEATDGLVPPSKEESFQIVVEGAPYFETDLMLCSTLPMIGPSALVLEFDEGVDAGALRSFLRAPALATTQYAYLHCNRAIFAILADTPDAPGLTEDKTLPPFSLPSLRYISWGQEEELKGKEQALETLERMLAARQAIGAGVDELTVLNSKMMLSEADVAPFSTTSSSCGGWR